MIPESPGPLDILGHAGLPNRSRRAYDWSISSTEDYTLAGTPLVWVVDPVRWTITVISRDTPVRWLREGNTLDGSIVIPGFSCRVDEIFEGIAREA